MSAPPKPFRCAICEKVTSEWGNNPWPYPGDRCCDMCNGRTVLPARVVLMNASPPSLAERLARDLMAGEIRIDHCSPETGEYSVVDGKGTQS
jgi:hypothetical protein